MVRRLVFSVAIFQVKEPVDLLECPIAPERGYVPIVCSDEGAYFLRNKSPYRLVLQAGVPR